MSSKNHLTGHTLYFAKLVCKTQPLEYKATTKYAANSEIYVFSGSSKAKTVILFCWSMLQILAVGTLGVPQFSSLHVTIF